MSYLDQNPGCVPYSESQAASRSVLLLLLRNTNMDDVVLREVIAPRRRHNKQNDRTAQRFM